jgi:hypothetical protein
LQWYRFTLISFVYCLFLMLALARVRFCAVFASQSAPIDLGFDYPAP